MPNSTHRFTICGNPKIFWKDPPKEWGLKPRRRYSMYVMPDDDIFFDELEVGDFIFQRMMRAILDGEFELGRRFEIRVNDMSDGPGGYFEVKPLDWKPNPRPLIDDSCGECGAGCDGCC